MTPINLEAKKDGLQQLQSGHWKVTFVVNGEDMNKAVEFHKAAMGQRYQMFLVALDEEDEESAHRALEKATKKRHWDKLSRAEQAGILCADEQFQNWIADAYEWNIGDTRHAADFVRQHCQVVSRSLLDVNKYAAKNWDQLVSQFRQETGREAEIR